MIAKDIWFWCLERKFHLSVAHVPGVYNTEADEESRQVNDDTEWFDTSSFRCIYYCLQKLYPDTITYR